MLGAGCMGRFAIGQVPYPFSISPIPYDSHDALLPRKLRRRDFDLTPDIEISERRRKHIQSAIYDGREKLWARLYSRPKTRIVVKPRIETPAVIRPEIAPDAATIAELAKVVLNARQAQEEKIRVQQLADDEDDLEFILKDIL